MMIFALLIATLASASAFKAPFKASHATTALAAKSKSVPFKEAPTNLEGMVGNKEFDPIGFSDSLNPLFLREAELKHGRIAMLATVGFVATEFLKLPGEVHNVSPIAAHDAAVSSGAMFQILTFVVALEFISIVAIKEMLEGSGREPGYYGFDPAGVMKGLSSEGQETMKLKELENGRLAMLAFSGMVTQAVLSGKGFPYM